MSKILDTVLLLALPASGKSEVRKYLASRSPEQCREEFHMGQTLQLDDYPYVHFMHRIDDELFKRGYPYVFYKGPNRPFQNDFEWGTLIELLNEDYDDLINSRVVEVPSAAQLLFDRLDNARAKVGLPRELAKIPYGMRCEIAAVLEEEVAKELETKNETCAQKKDGKTVVIEAARGGPNGAAFPLTPPHGYQYSINRFSDDVLQNASILYVWVTPEESRRKNIVRGLPNAQGSILHHSVPMEVMLAQYGCDDMAYLMGLFDKENSIMIDRLVTVKENGKEKFKVRRWYLPVARFDNRDDLTSFLRKEQKDWEDKEINAIHQELKRCFSHLISFND